MAIFRDSFSPDSRFFATGCEDNSLNIGDKSFSIRDNIVNIWLIETGKLHKTLEDRPNSMPKGPVAFSSDGKFLATAGSDNTIKLWRVDSWTLNKTLVGYTDKVSCIAFSPNNQFLAVASEKQSKYALFLLARC